MDEWPPLERTLGPAAFYSLYRGALAADSVQRRLSRCYVLVLGGRLGLRPDEMLHCHEGWIDWGRGELEIPALDPCACQECWAAARARRAAGDERPLDEIVRTEQWSPATEAGVRTVAFGWSERTTALLATFFDYVEYLKGDRATVRELIRESAEAAEGVDPGGLTPAALRATAGRFLAEVGFDATSIQHLLGLPDREPAAAFVRHAGQRTSAGLYSVFDRDAIGPDVPPAKPARKFPIVADPAPFSREPFDAAGYGPDARFERAKNEAGTRVRNPRPAAVPTGFEYDPADHEMPEQADPEGGQFSETAAADATDMAALRDWITRKDASLRKESSGVASDSPVASGMDHERVQAADEPARADGPPAEPEPLDSGGGASSGGSRSESAAPATPASPPRPTVPSDAETATEAVTEPLVARVSTRIAVPGIADGDMVEGQVVLGQDELLFLAPPTDGDLSAVDARLVPLDAVADVVPGGQPADVDEGAESTLGVAWDGADGREIAAIELDGKRRDDFWLALFRNALHVSRMDVTHPAKVGGRVTDASATPGMLYLDRERVRFTPLGADTTLVEIDLSEILHVERTRQDADAGSQPALAIQQFVDGEALTSIVGSDDTRTLTLFERFVRRDYRERLAAARELTIPDREKEVLVALYSTGTSVDLSQIVSRNPDELAAIVDSLYAKDLVTTDGVADCGLTARGRLVVSDRLEAVND